MCADIASTADSLPLSSFRILTTRQVDEAADAISRYQAPIRIEKVSDPKRFRLSMNGSHLGRVFVGFNEYATETMIDAGRVENEVVIVFGHEKWRPAHLEIDDDCAPASLDRAAVVSPTRHTRVWRPGKSRMFVLAMSSSVLASRYEEITGATIRRPIVFSPSLDLTQGPGRLLRETFAGLVSELERGGPGSEKTLLGSSLEDSLVSLTLALPGNHSAGPGHGHRHDLASWTVRRAEEYMVAHAADPITLSHLVTVCGCSSSALYNAFKSDRGYTPMQFLASRRLELARERLMQEPAATATAIALDCGFNNHGRFAKAYRRRFGESPSATRARCHGPLRR